MLGWNIGVYRQTNGGNEPAGPNFVHGQRLGIWQTDPPGLDWLRKLVESGNAIDLGGDGYPFRFTALVEHLIQPILDGPPDANEVWGAGGEDILSPQWVGRTSVDRDRLRECRPDEWLLVEAFDES